jgi:undecaprenyl-diphosphatase
VAVALIFGGIAMLLVEARRLAVRTETVESMGPLQALSVGLAQIVALIPGMSRSAWTLIGGMFSGLDRSTALRFSFYLSIPTLGSATLYDLYKSRDLLSADAIPVFAVGLIVSFIVALFVVKFFLGWVARHDLKPFAWYRIAAGLALLGLTATGILRA